VVSKEIIEFSSSGSQASAAMQDIVKDMLKENPDVSYTRINCDEDPDLVKTIIASQPPTVSPFFVSFKDGKISKSLAGIASVEDLEELIK
jgi:thioredoxin-like negative regulator of GroEL